MKVACRSRWMSGSATFTIVTSSSSMNVADADGEERPPLAFHVPRVRTVPGRFRGGERREHAPSRELPAAAVEPPPRWTRCALRSTSRSRRRSVRTAGGRLGGRERGALRRRPGELARMAKQPPRRARALRGRRHRRRRLPHRPARHGRACVDPGAAVFFVAAAYGFDPHDPMRPAEQLVLFDSTTTPSRRARARRRRPPLVARPERAGGAGPGPRARLARMLGVRRRAARGRLVPGSRSP